VRVVCEAEATPAIESFLWTFRGRPVTSGPDHSILETQHGATVRSSLLVASLAESQLGEYTCTVTNALGAASATISIRPVGEPHPPAGPYSLLPADGLPLLIMVAAAIGGLLLTLVLIVVVVTCRRMARHPTKPAADKHSPQPDQLSNSSSQGTKAATLSTISAPDDLDGSDSLPEYHANYMAASAGYGHQHIGYKSQPDLVHGHGHGGPSALEPGWHGYGLSRHLYAGATEPYYRRYVTSTGDLHDGGAYRQYSTPVHIE
jgi:hypothetical protein